MKEIPWRIYQTKLPIAYEIYNELYPDRPRTNREWSNGFNIRDKIVRALLKSDANSSIENNELNYE